MLQAGGRAHSPTEAFIIADGAEKLVGSWCACGKDEALDHRTIALDHREWDTRCVRARVPLLHCLTCNLRQDLHERAHRRGYGGGRRLYASDRPLVSNHGARLRLRLTSEAMKSLGCGGDVCCAPQTPPRTHCRRVALINVKSAAGKSCSLSV